jgi:hypothetical protein
VFCAPEVTARMASSVLGIPTTFDDGGGDVLGELINMVAGRIVSQMSQFAFKASYDLPCTARVPEPWRARDNDEIYFHSPDIGVFCVRFALGDC